MTPVGYGEPACEDKRKCGSKVDITKWILCETTVHHTEAPFEPNASMTRHIHRAALAEDITATGEDSIDITSAADTNRS